MASTKLHSPRKTIGGPESSAPLATNEYLERGFVVRAPPDRTLRREVLKWIQGLDLSHSIKNARRDAANGYVIAEICSRYFPTEINMHSYENGSSMHVKADNWSQLTKFFARCMPRFRLDEDAVDGVARQSPGRAVDLLEALYVAFTLKPLAPQAPLMRDDSFGGPLIGGRSGLSANESRRSVGSDGSLSGSPRTVRRLGEGPLAVKFEGIKTLPQETAAQARARLAEQERMTAAAASAKRAR